jgi:pimeloyl-ACP methyl ester carboxylesterase
VTVKIAALITVFKIDCRAMTVKQEQTMVFDKIDVAGVEVELWRQGSGRPIVYLHPGDGLDSAMPFLSALAENHQVYAASHPGFGGSQLPAGFTTVDDLAYFYLDFLEANAISDAVLVGISFGAWLAAEIAVKCTDRLSGLVLTDTLGAKFGSRETREISDLFALPHYDLGSLLYSDRRKLDFSDLSDEALVRLARNHESFALFGWSPTLYDPKLTQRLHRIKIPTLVLWGAEDRVVSPEYGRRFAAAIPNARFEMIDGAGHYPQVERTDRFIAAVEGFISALPNDPD